MLGLYVSDHPLMGAERALRRYVDCTLAELREVREGEMRTVGGVVTALQPQVHEARRPHGHVRARGPRRRDRGDGVPEDDGQYGELLDDDAIVVREGPRRRARRHAEAHRDGDHPARARARRRPAGADPGASSARSPTTKVARLKEILAEHPGDSPVFVHLEGPEKTTVLRLGDDYLVDAGNGLFAELRVLLGADCIT